jgi:hypothetical protein
VVASWLAWASVNEPLIVALPVVIAPWLTAGADSTTPSRVIANWPLPCWLEYCW